MAAPERRRFRRSGQLTAKSRRAARVTDKESAMIKWRLTTTCIAAMIVAACSSEPPSAGNEGEPARSIVRTGPVVDSFHLPRDLEIQVAESALPRHLQERATIYVLNPRKGFEVARAGTNGFHAFLARIGDDAFRGNWSFTEYRTDIIYPIAFDEVGSKANMRVFFDAAEFQAQGTPPADLKKLIKQRYASGYYKAPDRGGVSYMLSPILRTYIDPENSGDVETSTNPHIMHYAPNVSNQALGGVKPSINPLTFIIQEGPHGFAVQHLGEKEMAAIKNHYAPMLDRLCGLNPLWCLPDDGKQ
ncbi:hypothetical protein ACMGDH_10875 [Sphingomonas sp. DT-207]|uniref:hypothetical protein n=1 Tax=Sphingomonas sp. DT-207 TaxID=3396167 RepID=UPI003F1C346D